MYLFILLIGAICGFLSGLLGIGGGIVLFPALLYFPPLIGLDPIDVRYVSGLTMVQGFFASLTAFIFYRRRRLVSRPLVIWLGGPLAFMSFLGALYSGRSESLTIMSIFGVLAVLAAAMMLRSPEIHSTEREHGELRVRIPLAVVIGSVLGFFLGMVGQGGAFIIIPVMLVIFRAHYRLAAGSMLAISLISTTAGFLGKAEAGLVPVHIALVLLSGAIPMAWIGGMMSTRVRTDMLRKILAVIILLSALRIAFDVYSAYFS